MSKEFGVDPPIWDLSILMFKAEKSAQAAIACGRQQVFPPGTEGSMVALLVVGGRSFFRSFILRGQPGVLLHGVRQVAERRHFHAESCPHGKRISYPLQGAV